MFIYKFKNIKIQILKDISNNKKKKWSRMLKQQQYDFYIKYFKQKLWSYNTISV